MGTRSDSPLLLVESPTSKQLGLCCCLNLDKIAEMVRNKLYFNIQRMPNQLILDWNLLNKADYGQSGFQKWYICYHTSLKQTLTFTFNGEFHCFRMLWWVGTHIVVDENMHTQILIYKNPLTKSIFKEVMWKNILLYQSKSHVSSFKSEMEDWRSRNWFIFQGLWLKK